MPNKLLLLITVLFVILSTSYAQETQKNIDSLLVVLQKAKEDTSKVILYQKIAGHYNVTQLDSAKAFADNALLLANQLQYAKGKWMSHNVLGNYYERKTDYDNAMMSYNKALAIVEEQNSTKGFAVILNNIATIHIRKAEYQTAIDLMFDALKAEEELNNQNGVAQAYNNIGVCYYYMQNFEKTTFYLTKALEIQESLGNYDGLINGHNNVGAILDYQKKYDEAIVSYQKGLDISRKIGDRKNEAIQLLNIGMAHVKNKDLNVAESFLTESLTIREDIQDFNGMASSYISFGQTNLALGKPNEAESYLLKSLDISEKHGLKLSKREAYGNLAEVYESKNDYKKANEYLYKYDGVKDSIFNDSNAEIIAEAATKYETEKKEKKILAQRTEIAEKELEVKQKNTLIYGSLGLAAILGLLGYLFYSQQKLKNKQILKESELKTALVKIETQNRLQEQRLRISRDLHDNIGSQLTFIISSIDNLKFGFKDINQKLGDKLSGISGFTNQTIYELRDTIWAMNKTSISFEDLQARIGNFIDKARDASEKTKFSFNMAPEVDPEHTLTSVDGMNMYRIIQEAVNNALKYADASKIDVDVSEMSENFNIKIQDNGTGFATTEVTDGNGLNNMKKRARDLNGSFSMDSKLGEGTSISVVFPKQK